MPKDYREFLKTTNGGGVNPQVSRCILFDVKGPYSGAATTSEEQQLFGYLFTLSVAALDNAGMSNHLNLHKSYQSYLVAEHDYPNRPVDFVPIGCSAGPDFIILGIRGEHYGKVACYEFMEHDIEKPMEDVFHIADSFDGFFDELYFLK